MIPARPRGRLHPWQDCWSLVQNFGGAPTSPYGTIVKSALAHQAAAVDG